MPHTFGGVRGLVILPEVCQDGFDPKPYSAKADDELRALSRFPHVSCISHLHSRDVNNSADTYFSTDHGIPNFETRITEIFHKIDILGIKFDAQKEMIHAFQTSQKEMTHALQTQSEGNGTRPEGNGTRSPRPPGQCRGDEGVSVAEARVRVLPHRVGK